MRSLIEGVAVQNDRGPIVSDRIDLDGRGGHRHDYFSFDR